MAQSRVHIFEGAIAQQSNCRGGQNNCHLR